MVAVSVLVLTSGSSAALPGFVRSVDAQTLPAAEFELVVVDASGADRSARLQQLADRRPNVTVLSTEVAAADRFRSAVHQATGEYALVIEQDQRLAPRALELLLDSARRTGADVVLGRAATGTTSGSAVLPDDADELDSAGFDPVGCFGLVRRSLLQSLADASPAPPDLRAVIAAAGTVSAVGRYACAVGQADPPGIAADVHLGVPTYSWLDGRLRLVVDVRLAAPPPAVRAWLVITRGAAEIASPATIEWDERDRVTGRASADVDPSTAEGGHPLEGGLWQLQLRLAWPHRESTVPLAPGGTRAGVVAGRPYVVRAAAGVAKLDAGALETSVVGPVARSRASVDESEKGALVALDYPDVHVHGDAVLAGRIVLGTFSLPARLMCRDGHARLEAYIGSLAGTSDVAVVVGGGKPVRTGLRLRVSGTGSMALEDSPAPEPAQRPAPATGHPPLVQRMRRRVPDALDPVARRLARVPVLRRAYRRLISR